MFTEHRSTMFLLPSIWVLQCGCCLDFYLNILRRRFVRAKNTEIQKFLSDFTVASLKVEENKLEFL